MCPELTEKWAKAILKMPPSALKELVGRLQALEDFSHPGLDRILQWDLRYGRAVVAELIPYVADPLHRARLEAASREAWARIAPHADDLPRQAVHLDLTDANVVVGAAGPDGVIDFGDLTNTWAVSDLAITASSVLAHTETAALVLSTSGRHVTWMRPAMACAPTSLKTSVAS